MSDESTAGPYEFPKHPGGRPTKYKPEYCELAIELAQMGFSKAQIAAHIGVDKETLPNWAEKHPEFEAALKLAKTYEQAVFERNGYNGMFSRDFNASVWSRSMAARFPADYTEQRRNVIAGDPNAPITIRSVDDLTDEQLADIARRGRAAPSESEKGED